MTEVRIRHQDDIVALPLADVPFDQLDSVIPTILRWGLEDRECDLSGQFVYGDRGAYFEVVIHEEDPA